VLLRSFALAVLLSLSAAGSALADATTSRNWSGYVAHYDGVSFRSVSAQWRIPAATCGSAASAYSSIWIGLGGYSAGLAGLEQTGVEVDCARSGRASYSAWYELVPAPSHRVAVPVSPGDLIRARVSVSGARVEIRLEDVTKQRAFRRSFHPAQIDTASADWIVEAPSDCDASGNCQTLPLADFGRASFVSAQATTAGGHAGGIANQMWTSTMITLVPGGDRFAAAGPGTALAQAVPSPLAASGTAFTDVYQVG
jgi:hypothetical protein